MGHLWEALLDPQGADKHEEEVTIALELCHIFSHIMQFNNGQHFRRHRRRPPSSSRSVFRFIQFIG